MACTDEATYGLIPLIARGWARKGSRPAVTVNCKHAYTNVFGARTKQTFVYMFATRKTQKNFVRFLHKLHRRWGRVLLFADNVSAHRGTGVKKFIAAHRATFRLEYFLPYTPELNPVEQCWKPGRRALANRALHTLPAAKYHLRKAFSDPEALPKMFEYLGD